MKDFSKLAGKEIRIKKYGYGKVIKVKDDSFTFKIPVDDMKWEKLELDNKFLKHAKELKDSELDKKRFRISFIIKNFYKKLFSSVGRTTRKEYFFGRLISSLLVIIPSAVLGHFIMTNEPEKLFVYLACALTIFALFTLIGTISITARRLQDVGYKGSLALLFYIIMLGLLLYGLWTLEEPLIFASVLGVIYLIFEIIMITSISDFDNKFGPCPVVKLDDDDHVDGKLVIKKEGTFTNLKEFTEKVKKDNEVKEEQKLQNEKVLQAEKRLLEKQKVEKEKKIEETKKREEKGESLKELSDRIRREAKGELERNPERLRSLPKKEEKEDNDFLAEMMALEKIETNKLLKEYEDLYEKGDISKEEYQRLKKELLK